MELQAHLEGSHAIVMNGFGNIRLLRELVGLCMFKSMKLSEVCLPASFQWSPDWQRLVAHCDRISAAVIESAWTTHLHVRALPVDTMRIRKSPP